MSKRKKKKQGVEYTNPQSYLKFQLPKFRTYYRPNNSILSPTNIETIKQNVKSPRRSITKFRGKNLSANRLEYNRQVQRIRNIENRMRKQGYNVQSLIPKELPKRVTGKTILDLKQITPRVYRQSATRTIELPGSTFINVKHKDISSRIRNRKPLPSKTQAQRYLEREKASKPKVELSKEVKNVIHKQNLNKLSKGELLQEFAELSQKDQASLIENIDKVSVNDTIEEVYINREFKLEDDEEVELLPTGENVEFPDIGVELMKNMNGSTDHFGDMTDEQFDNYYKDLQNKEMQKPMSEVDYTLEWASSEDTEFYFNKTMELLNRLPESKSLKSGGKVTTIPGIREGAKAVLQNTKDDLYAYTSVEDEKEQNKILEDYLGKRINDIARSIEVIIYESGNPTTIEVTYDELLSVLSMGDLSTAQTIVERYVF